MPLLLKYIICNQIKGKNLIHSNREHKVPKDYDLQWFQFIIWQMHMWKSYLMCQRHAKHVPVLHVTK